MSDPWHSIATGIELAVGERRPEYFDIPAANPYALRARRPRGRRRRRAPAPPRAGRRARPGAHDRRRPERCGERPARPARLISRRARERDRHPRPCPASTRKRSRSGLAAQVVGAAAVERRGEAVAEQPAAREQCLRVGILRLSQRLGERAQLRRGAPHRAARVLVAERRGGAPGGVRALPGLADRHCRASGRAGPTQGPADGPATAERIEHVPESRPRLWPSQTSMAVMLRPTRRGAGRAGSRTASPRSRPRCASP